MHLVDGVTTLSPSDLVGFLACEHLTQLELAAARGQVERPSREDPELDLLSRLGESHERAQLHRLRDADRSIAVIPDAEETLEGLRSAEAQTLRAMRDGVDVVYQAAFFDGTWRGRADFLLRVETPSALGSWSYEVADAKLARSVKVAALLQMCEYSLQVARLQGRAPARMHVILGDGAWESHDVAEYDAYHRAARSRFEAAVRSAAPGATYPDPVEHCAVCRWRDPCVERRRADDHLSLVAGMRRDQTRRLVAAGIPTVAALAAVPTEPAPDIGDAPWRRLRRQARLQVDERTTGVQSWELLPRTEPGLGLAALPPPSPGDLFFDMEGDPFVNGDGLEYLFGVTEVVDDVPRFHGFWAHDRAEEKRAFESLIDLVADRLARDPQLHVYHYASYEPTALKRLMGRHATREDEVDRLLRGGVLVDLHQVVRQGVCVSKERYSLKSLEAFYMPKRAEVIADAASSIVAYERWLETGDDQLLEDIERYNERDCESTRLLRDWLEARRVELELRTGEPLPRPGVRSAEPPESVAEASADTRELVERLTLGVDADAAVRAGEDQARWLLAQLLDWHRREAKSGWWEYFARRGMTDEELVEDSESIGALTHVGKVGAAKRSIVHRYRFDPAQEHKLDPGDDPHDPRTGKSCGRIVRVDNDRGVIELRRGPSLAESPHPTSLIPTSPIPTTPMRLALRRVACDVIVSGMTTDSRYRAVCDLLMAAAPHVAGAVEGVSLVGEGEDPVAATCRLVDGLQASTLAVQGPPGCGKTFTGAHVVVDLVARRRRRVGVCATTHRAIANLLSEISAVAARKGEAVRILQKCDAEQRCSASGVRHATHNDEVVDALLAGDVDVVAGTPWLFADERLDGVLDVLVVDESGQMSLANACAVGTSARSLVLLGDPQQLAQPSQGIHPDGAGVSALEHLLGDADTIAPDRGVFLPVTRRMHPEVCAFVSSAFYDGRLTSHPSCAAQSVRGDSVLEGAGIRTIAVEHRGNRTWSPEEVDAVREILARTWLATWTDADGVERPMSLEDVLVVAPYNAQVKRLRDAVRGIRAGTVDRFQGQQAAVAIYTMATSSADDMPRTLEFLFSRNRLNVAVSRARALAFVVCSPQLLATRCRTPEQLRLVNALCRFVEMSPVSAPLVPLPRR